jgi:hypothetical protein
VPRQTARAPRGASQPKIAGEPPVPPRAHPAPLHGARDEHPPGRRHAGEPTAARVYPEDTERLFPLVARGEFTHQAVEVGTRGDATSVEVHHDIFGTFRRYVPGPAAPPRRRSGGEGSGAWFDFEAPGDGAREAPGRTRSCLAAPRHRDLRAVIPNRWVASRFSAGDIPPRREQGVPSATRVDNALRSLTGRFVARRRERFLNLRSHADPLLTSERTLMHIAHDPP